jgi:hypothetical protein
MDASWVFWVDVFIEQLIGIGYEVTGGDLSLLREVIKSDIISKYQRNPGGSWDFTVDGYTYNIMLAWRRS